MSEMVDAIDAHIRSRVSAMLGGFQSVVTKLTTDLTAVNNRLVEYEVDSCKVRRADAERIEKLEKLANFDARESNTRLLISRVRKLEEGLNALKGDLGALHPKVTCADANAAKAIEANTRLHNRIAEEETGHRELRMRVEVSQRRERGGARGSPTEEVGGVMTIRSGREGEDLKAIDEGWDRTFGPRKFEARDARPDDFSKPLVYTFKCPGCGGGEYRVSIEGDKGSSFVFTKLKCLRCADGQVLEEQVPPGSLLGDFYGITFPIYIADLEQRLAMAKRRAAEEGR